MANNEYIIINGSPFIFTNRSSAKMEIAGEIERSLSGKAHKDRIDTTKRKWSFLFENVNDKVVYRLQKLFDLHDELSLTDYDDQDYTALWATNEFAPTETTSGCFSITVDFEEV